MILLEIDGRRAACGTGGTTWQDGRPLLVFIHGAGNDHSVWALQARALAQSGWNVLTPDLPGHGQSEDLSSIDSVRDYADWIHRLAESLGHESYGVVGHSMGACIAVDLAASSPERIEKLAALGAGEAIPVNDTLLENTLQRPLEAHRFITAFGHGRGAHFGRAETPGLWMLGSAMALLDRCAPAVLHRDFAACNEWRGGQAASSIRCPTLVLSGAVDRMTPPRAGRALAARVEGARFEILDDTGHMMMAESPSAVTARLRDFLGGASH